MDIGRVLALIILLMVVPVGLGVGAITVFQTTGSLDVESSRDPDVHQTANSTFDNTESWDNSVSGGCLAVFENWGPGRDNVVGDNIDNTGSGGICYFYQSLTVNSYDGVSSATVQASYLISDNSGLENLTIAVRLERPSGDNVDIIVVDNTNHVADNSTWYAVDNDVTSLINGAGTYRLFLFDNAARVDTSGFDNLAMIRWDNASLVVTTYDRGYLENIVLEVESNTDTGFDLGSLMPMIIAAVALISILVLGFTGLLKTRTSRRF